MAEGKEINMYYFSFPVIVDWNEDGLLDLMVSGNGPSKKQCNLPIYLNEGTKTEYKFTTPLVHKEDGGLGLPFMEPRIAPQILDLDGDGKKDMVIGKMSYGDFAGMDFYKNIGTNAAPELADPVPIKDTNGDEKWAPNAPAGKNPECHPTFADWNGDGVLDIIIGGESGWNNLHISYGKGKVAVENNTLSKAKKSITIQQTANMISLHNSFAHKVQCSILKLNGALVQESFSIESGTFKTLPKSMAKGVYVVHIAGAGVSLSKKLIIK